MINTTLTATRLRPGMLLAMRDQRTPARSTDNPTMWMRVVDVRRGMFTRVTLPNRATVRLMPNNVVLVGDVHLTNPELWEGNN